MLLFPNCKINIGLRVVAKRTDGYHDIETVMYPVRGLCDALEILPDATDDISFTSSGLETGVDPERNICVRAYRAFREACPIGGVRMHLHKTIPMGAGLGGGSADARYRPGRNPRSRSGFADRTQAGHRQTGRIGQYGRSLRRRRARTARKPARRFVRAAAPAMERTHRQRLRDIRFPHSSDDRGDQRRTLSGGGSLCFHVRFGICRLRNFRRADAGSTGIRRNVCISGRYDLSECEKRG